MPNALQANFTSWVNKPFIGGYKSTKTEFYNATTQTGTKPTKPLQYHRDSQTVDTRTKEVQSRKEEGCQTLMIGQTSRNDLVVIPRKYYNSEDWQNDRTLAATRIQTLYRGYKTRVLVSRLVKERNEKVQNLETEITLRQKLLEMEKKKDSDKRANPKSRSDFRKLRVAIDEWCLANQSSSHDYTCLITKLDILKHRQCQGGDDFIKRKLDLRAKPKEWRAGKDCHTVFVDTLDTRHARNIRDLYTALNLNTDRIHVLKSVKQFVRDEELDQLIDREIDMIYRGRGEMEGLRKRICSVFLKACGVDMDVGKEKRFLCKGCEGYKALSEFGISATLKQLGKCSVCIEMEDVVMKRLDKADFGKLLDQVKVDEAQREAGGPITLLQESDLKYLVDIIWTRKSAISGPSLFEALTLTRWIVSEPLSPWNCILLTKDEAMSHLVQPSGVYSEEFKRGIEQKLVIGREYFKQLPKLLEYSRKY